MVDLEQNMTNELEPIQTNVVSATVPQAPTSPLPQPPTKRYIDSKTRLIVLSILALMFVFSMMIAFLYDLSDHKSSTRTLNMITSMVVQKFGADTHVEHSTKQVCGISGQGEFTRGYTWCKESAMVYTFVTPNTRKSVLDAYKAVSVKLLNAGWTNGSLYNGTKQTSDDFLYTSGLLLRNPRSSSIACNADIRYSPGTQNNSAYTINADCSYGTAMQSALTRIITLLVFLILTWFIFRKVYVSQNARSAYWILGACLFLIMFFADIGIIFRFLTLIIT